MNVAELIEELKQCPQDAKVYHSSDGEGNRIRPFSDVGISVGSKETDRYGEIDLVAEEDIETGEVEADDYHEVVVLWPV